MQAYSRSFNSLSKVLFKFPSWYFCSIGTGCAIKFCWDLPPVHTQISKSNTHSPCHNSKRQRLRGYSPHSPHISEGYRDKQRDGRENQQDSRGLKQPVIEPGNKRNSFAITFTLPILFLLTRLVICLNSTDHRSP